MSLFDAPNLDAMDVDELAEFMQDVSLLHDYASTKMRAMKFRLEGKIKDALLFEEECEALYRRLPPRLKW